METRKPIVQMKNIRKSFGGVHAVNDVSIDIYPGEVVGLLGHNGAGKSTLVQILSGAIVKDSGEILINDQPVNIRNPKDAKDLGIETIYQTLALADNLNAIENLFLGREIKKLGLFRDKKKMEAEAKKVLKEINPMFTNIYSASRNLSGGQRQSIAIGRAIYFNAKILILDEPTAALGPSETALFKELVTRIKKQNVGIILISHDMTDVFEITDRIVVMSDGKVVGRRETHKTDKDEVLKMIILGKAYQEEINEG